MFCKVFIILVIKKTTKVAPYPSDFQIQKKIYTILCMYWLTDVEPEIHITQNDTLRFSYNRQEVLKTFFIPRPLYITPYLSNWRVFSQYCYKNKIQYYLYIFPSVSSRFFIYSRTHTIYALKAYSRFYWRFFSTKKLIYYFSIL